MRKTKIVCTLGPACAGLDTLKELIESGMDGARFNFSHGTHESHAVMVESLKRAREETGRPIPMILDTKGPEIRIKTFKEGSVFLEQGQIFTLTARDVEGDSNIVSVTHADLPSDLRTGGRVLLDDGLVELRVKELTNTDIICEVVNSGALSDRKGVNVPDVYVSLPSLTEKDVEDIIFGIKMGFDYIAASFIRSESDVLKIRQVLEDNGGADIKIISKIESRDGVSNASRILDVSDGIMVARGDLGVELAPEEVPIKQKYLIRIANEKSKPVITATQMLESMVKNPRPTRAEVNDVANAIYDGSDAIMLSGETASGAHPVESVRMMARIAETTEKNIDYYGEGQSSLKLSQTHITNTNAISHATFSIARDLEASCIAAITSSGFTARMISKFRPKCPILAITPYDMTRRQLNLTWGCCPVLYNQPFANDKVFEIAVEAAEREGLAKTGDSVVIAASLPVEGAGTTNALKIQVIGNIFTKGTGFGDKIVHGRANVVRGVNEEGAYVKEIFEGDILVVTRTNDELIPLIKKASCVIVGTGGDDEHRHVRTACKSLNIPYVICRENVTDLIPDSIEITVDTAQGFVYNGKK
ncbi:MAG: pyruvate kinase [Clostridiales bacterium]|jgi:pyruvate kinase|nr:pyruvate kinase [Clostridiales bacterium]